MRKWKKKHREVVEYATDVDAFNDPSIENNIRSYVWYVRYSELKWREIN